MQIRCLLPVSLSGYSLSWRSDPDKFHPDPDPSTHIETWLTHLHGFKSKTLKIEKIMKIYLNILYSWENSWFSSCCNYPTSKLFPYLRVLGKSLLHIFGNTVSINVLHWTKPNLYEQPLNYIGVKRRSLRVLEKGLYYVVVYINVFFNPILKQEKRSLFKWHVK